MVGGEGLAGIGRMAFCLGSSRVLGGRVVSGLRGHRCVQRMRMSGVPVRKSAAALIIGDEILTGKTVDTNSNFLAKFLFARGVDLKRVEVIPDDMEDIGDSVKRLSNNFDYVFTSGGIGPTHDDLTYEAIARAYGLDLEVDESIVAEMKRIQPDGEVNESRLRMATIPTKCEKLETEGLWVPLVVVNGNVYILPGVPVILERMVNAASSRFGNGLPPRSRRIVYTKMHEGDLAESVGKIANKYPQVAIGSYPRTDKTHKYNVKITLEADDQAQVEAAASEVVLAINGVDDANKL
ncbi:hypothetical protein NDN08_005881 [Rhodosorus marinus]|uniref:MoaB/Mog domain-containing protein n=1 Tax=Rhodosorus marinus TaxID=101924 RepID=A0AAV8V4W6_9RHOD|nr:hypothetical protein NDN08_005881 [Rhodosorus marinus]